MCTAKQAGQGVPPWLLLTSYRSSKLLAYHPSITYVLVFDHMQVNGLGVEEAVAVVRKARPHILLQGKHFEALRTFHSHLNDPVPDN